MRIVRYSTGRAGNSSTRRWAVVVSLGATSTGTIRMAFAKKMFGLTLKSANTKTAGANKVLKSRKGVHNIAIDKC